LETGWHSVLEVETVIYVVSNIVLPFLKKEAPSIFMNQGSHKVHIGHTMILCIKGIITCAVSLFQ
jgi:hypothetical protein